MKRAPLIYGVLIGMLAIGVVGCRSDYHSAFAEQAIRPNQLVKIHYKTLKTGAVERAPDSSFFGSRSRVLVKTTPSGTCWNAFRRKGSIHPGKMSPSRMRPLIVAGSDLSA